MKKSLFGYDVSEVDQSIEYYESQIEILTAKLSHLNAEIVAKDEIIENLESLNNKGAGTGVDITSFKKRIANLEEINKKSADENTALFNENENLKRQIAELERQLKGNESITDVGKLCEEVYSDMALVKKRTAEEMQTYINTFVEITESHNKDISDSIEEIKRARDFAQNNFIDLVEEMLVKFSEMSGTSKGLELALKRLENAKNNLYNNVNKYLIPPEEDTEENPEEAEDTFDDINLSAPILYSALSKRKKDRESKKAEKANKEKADDDSGDKNVDRASENMGDSLENVRLSIL